MTQQEKTLINDNDDNTPFRVLLVTNEEDSLLLRKKSTDIDVRDITNPDWQLFIKRLKLTMDIESGVGIAAVQVGIARNLFLFMRLDKPDNPVEVAINPRIILHPDNTICFEKDGCLSIPDMSGDTFRYPWVEVEYYDEKGKLKRDLLKGYSREGDFTGIIFQHEYDHLQGILYTDRLCGENDN